MAKKKSARSTRKTAAAKKGAGRPKRATTKKRAAPKVSKEPAARNARKSAKPSEAQPKFGTDSRLDTEKRPGFPIVGIGASAGGLEALEAFFKAMPADSGIAFVLVVHLDPTHISILPELLQKRTKMVVCQVKDGMLVEPNHVYVIPPNKNLTILHGTLQLMELSRPRGVNLPIDSFFRSLAQDQGRNAVCIILSGTGTDVTLGVKAIKGEVGMVMVQDEESAKYEGMPRSAIATGVADYVLPPGKMPGQLIKYTWHATQKMSPRIAPAEGPVPIALQKIFVILRSRTNHDFSLYKKNTICRRIERRMNVRQMDDIEDYVRHLQESETEATVLFKELLIGVTNFFRDPEAFDSLQTVAVRKLLANIPNDTAVRVWVPGCATGEEAYSVAILLHEQMEQMGRHVHLQIFGTDIDEDAIDVARAGLYPESIVVDVAPERLTHFFSREEDGQYRVKRSIRKTLVFAPQNVIKDPPFTKLDMLCCRNLLIYLGAELQKKLLPLFHYSLKPDGILFLGSSETIGQATDLFTPLHKKWKIFRRRNSASSSLPMLDFPALPAVNEPRDLEVPETIRKAEELSALQLIETVLRQSDTLPCVIIDDTNNIVYIHGHTGRFLEPAEGKASVNIIEMARPGLRMDLATVIRLVAIRKQEVTRRGLRVEHDDGPLFLNLTVKPILEQIAMRGLMMVIFEETETRTTTKAAVRKLGRTTAKRRNKTVEELERELQYTRENLQTTIEELETSNEELKSTNEELQSTNEELQSTNEELETSKEELQSLNEESATVNAELQARNDELNKTNDDMKNLLDSTEIATIFLDTDLRIRRFTPRATRIIPLAATDCGRPIKHLATMLVDTDIAEYGHQVLADLAVREIEAESKDGCFYIMRIRPYRTVVNVIDGVVITFDDTTKRKRAEAKLRESEARYRTLFDNANAGIVFLDSAGTYLMLNEYVARLMGGKPDDFIGKSLHEVFPDEADSHLRRFAKIMQEKKGATFEGPFPLPNGTRWFSSNIQPTMDSSGSVIGVQIVAIDITNQKLQEQTLRESEQRYRILFELGHESIVLIDRETLRFVEFNRRAHEHLGYTRAEFDKLTLLDVDAAESPSDIAKHVEKVAKQGSDVIETKHKTTDGKIHNVRIDSRLVSVGEKTFLLSTLRDMTPTGADS